MCLSKLLQASFCLDLYRQDFSCFPIGRSRGEKALAWGAGRRLLRVGGADRSEKCRGKGGPGRGNSQHKSTEGAGTCLAWLERRREGRQGPSHPSKGLECQAKGLPQGARKAFALQGMAGPDEREPALARSEPPLGLAPSPGASPRSPALAPRPSAPFLCGGLGRAPLIPFLLPRRRHHAGGRLRCAGPAETLSRSLITAHGCT